MEKGNVGVSVAQLSFTFHIGLICIVTAATLEDMVKPDCVKAQ